MTYTKFDIRKADPDVPVFADGFDQFPARGEVIVQYETNDENDDGFPDPGIVREAWIVRPLPGEAALARAKRTIGKSRTIHEDGREPRSVMVFVDGHLWD